MDHENEDQRLGLAFGAQKAKALKFIAAYNETLPSSHCPQCRDEGHVPGLVCPACGYRHHIAWAILRDNEWGYEVVPLASRKTVLARFNVEEEPL